MGNRIISISRQFGSGGHEVAVKTADLLGIRVYERELIRLACEYGELSEKTLSPSDEKATNPYLFQTVHEGNHHVLRGKPTSEVLFALQSHEIRRIARHEECVFVGRCADYVLRGEDVRLLTVFVAAPDEHRIQRKMAQEKLTRDQAIRLIRKMDKQRRKYYESYTHKTWGAPEGYDLYLDTGALSRRPRPQRSLRSASASCKKLGATERWSLLFCVPKGLRFSPPDAGKRAKGDILSRERMSPFRSPKRTQGALPLDPRHWQSRS